MNGDVFPIENGAFPAIIMLIFQGCTKWEPILQVRAMETAIFRVPRLR